ncbi:uncharacterized protein TRUGW13939_04299 [Talaromyces rugulosus]|uniref:Hypervirulence associated protein TUDOR domain-containing protein n=1 Tax=Talaromyces rugulosus TaxID=121627 RepID=A0A7H8QUJ8_TALRU|nr:uncharacterized protein TRUGW13939_04299 [Talaromyces rugulosus]QKX57191.1 hypothetical protein TRUGW13939_04299 [Talaromyces rugulosus]
MGGSVSKLMGKIFGSKEMRILMLGLDAAGKTTILYKLKLNQDVTTIPTVGFNVESVTYKNVKFNVWDVGGQDKIRPLWRHYYSGTQGLIFVVDSNDRSRIKEAQSELHKIISDREMKDALLLVFANKQDIPGCMQPEEITSELKLNSLSDRPWNVLPSVATDGRGIFEGLVSYFNMNAEVKMAQKSTISTPILGPSHRLILFDFVNIGNTKNLPSTRPSLYYYLNLNSIMPQYRVNDQVRYKPVGGRESNTSETVGVVRQVITEPGSLTGRQVQASNDDPRYEVENSNTGKRTAIKESNILSPA